MRRSGGDAHSAAEERRNGNRLTIIVGLKALLKGSGLIAVSIGGMRIIPVDGSSGDWYLRQFLFLLTPVGMLYLGLGLMALLQLRVSRPH